MAETEQLEQAIAVLQGQRAILGDAVVDAALGPMRERLAQLTAHSTPVEQQRKQVTVLFAHLSAPTALPEMLDAEEVAGLTNALWTRLDGAIAAHGGHIDKHMGDAVMALWGAAAAREDDPERALRAALELQAVVETFCAARHVPLGMRAGLNTGPVLLGEVGSTREFTAMGDTVNLAARLADAAPAGGTLISHATYRQVRGLFDVLPQEPLQVKGKARPVQAYLVQQARPRTFRSDTRGVEGIETRMIGREAELRALQEAFAAVEAGATRLVTVVGEAGVGKSRLLYEFESWLELHPQQVTFFKGRSAPALQGVPYGIVRDMFAHRFDILESDGTAAALVKFRAGMAGLLTPERADLVGHWVGFDFSASSAVQDLFDSPDFGKLAQVYLTHYVRAMAERWPAVIFLEDLHWADDSSLDLVAHLVAALPRARLLLVGLARPVLFERRPDWGAGTRLELPPLSPEASQDLVAEILQKVEVLPAALRDLIVQVAEGNPLYVEELVKMLLDEGVIERGADEQGAWRVSLERLREVRVPPTLTGILQTRLDGLPRRERELLQQAAVVGRRFWDAAVAELAALAQEQLRAPLAALGRRELVFRKGSSAFADTDEYLFKHALLRDVAYETVLLKMRRRYHALVARWLEVHAGERSDEYAGLIAEHLERAGQREQAAGYLRRVGERMLATSAFREALGFSQRALSLLPEESPERTALHVQAGRAASSLGDYGEARRQLDAGLALAQQLGDDRICAAALDFLGVVARQQGDRLLARTYLERSLELARQIDDRDRVAHVLYALGVVDIRQGAYAEARAHLAESRALCQSLGDRRGLARALNGLGGAASMLGAYEEAQAFYLESLALCRQTGARHAETDALNNLGETARLRGDYELARRCYREALDVRQEIGYHAGLATTINNLGHVAAALGDYPAATSSYYEALQVATGIGAIPYALDSLAGLAMVLARTGQTERALELLGATADHPALQDETRRQLLDPTLAGLRAQLPPEVVVAGLERGQALNLETVVAEFLTQAPHRGE